MKILVLGSGAREHAIVRALQRDGNTEVVCAPGNDGIGRDCETVRIDVAETPIVRSFVADHEFDLVVIGPEAPLVAGLADALRADGVAVFGPGREAARIEGSKLFAKRVMAAAGVPTGRATEVASMEEARAELGRIPAPWVLKADGLAAGKGVIVTDDEDAAAVHLERYLPDGPVLIEEYLEGEEVTLFFLTDGESVVPLAPAQDFKRLRDGDEGPNTGGMGAYSPLPWLDARFGSEAEFVAEVQRTIAEPVVRELAAQGTPFAGLFYCGLMLTDAGIRVIEFNARFGDPETQVVLARLRSPLAPALHAAATGTLASLPPLEFTTGAAVTVVLASDGYPDAPQTGQPLGGLDAAAATPGVTVLHAGTARDEERWFATGGRVLNVVGEGATLAEARERAYEALSKITLPGGHYRTDIAERQAR